MLRFALVVLAVLALAGCGGDGGGDGSAGDGDNAGMDEMDMAAEVPAESAAAMRWWNALTPEQMVAALYGDEATAEQAAAAQKMYGELDDDTRALVNAAADEIYDDDADYASVGDWWETLDCRLMRVAVGDGITADPMSPYCTHYPGSGFAKILSAEAKAHVDYVGMALLDRDTPGLFIPLVGRATHSIGTTLEYSAVREDGTTEVRTSLEYAEYGMHRGRDVLVVEYSVVDPDYPCDAEYWDLETGNTMACLGEDGELGSEWIPHNGVFAFPMAPGTREPWEYGWQSDGDEFCDEVCEGITETWTVEECGIELEVAAGTFTVCRQSAVSGWAEEDDLEWIEWYDPVRHLVVKTIYDFAWDGNDRAVTELSAYDLVERGYGME